MSLYQSTLNLIGGLSTNMNILAHIWNTWEKVVATLILQPIDRIISICLIKRQLVSPPIEYYPNLTIDSLPSYDQSATVSTKLNQSAFSRLWSRWEWLVGFFLLPLLAAVCQNKLTNKPIVMDLKDPARKINPKLTVRKLFISTIVFILLVVIFLQHAGKTEAAWFDDNYAYRKKITIENAGGADANKKIKLDIDTATLITNSKMQSDCDDIRFTDINGRLLKFYLDSSGGVCNSSSTDFYVLVPIIHSGNTVLYMYYGNPSATNGSESNQFSEDTFSPTSEPTAGSEEKSAGPVLHWTFNQSGVKDSTAQKNDSTTTVSLTWIADDYCVFEKCYFFNESQGSRIKRTYSSDNELDPGTNSFSVSVWFKHISSNTGTDTLVARVDNNSLNGVGYKIYMNSSGNMCFGIDDTAGSFPADSACSSRSYADSKWHQLTAVKNDTSSIVLYIDAMVVASDTSLASTNSISGSNTDLYVGMDSTGNHNGWTGFVDEFKIYPYARSAAQIKSDFQVITSKTGANAIFGGKSINELNQNLIGHWKMDLSTAGSNAIDASQNNPNLTNVNSTAPGNGRFLYGADLELDSSNYFYTADSAILSLTGNITLAAWINPESTTANTHFDIIGKWDGSNESYLLAQYGDELRFYIDSSNNYVETSAANLAPSTWYHVVGVYHAASQTAKIFVNGIEQTTTTTGTIPSSIGDDSGRFHIGAEDSTTSATNFYDGIIDEARLYNRILSPSEILQIYHFAPEPVAYIRLDDKTNNMTAIDNSINQNILNQSFGTPQWTFGKYGGGIYFDGINDYIGRAQTTSTALGLTIESYTLSAWIKTTTNFSSNAHIISKWTGESSYPYILYLNSSEQACFAIKEASNNPSACSSVALNDGQWHYITGVRDVYADNLYIYVDGILANTTADSTTASTKNNALIYIGNGGTDGTQFDFEGIIDEIKIYNYARTQKQIIQDMNADRPLGGSTGSQVSYWRLDEGYGTTANDISLNSNNLTLSTASWTNNGKFGKAWNGNGTNRLSRSDDADFDFTAAEDFTISIWFKSDSATNPNTTEYLADKESASAGYAIYANTNGTICFAIDDDSTWDPDVASCTNDDYYDATWHHIVGVRDYSGTDKTYIYIDGVLKDSDIDSTTATLANSDNLTIGDRDSADNGDEFTGDIDEVKIYRTSLLPNEILADFNRSSSAVWGGLSNNSSYDRQAANQEYCVPGDSSNCAAPVAEWKLDEKTGINAYDTGESGNTGSLDNNPTWTIGKRGAAVAFDGDDSITISSVTSTVANTASVVYWIKTTQTSNSSNFWESPGILGVESSEEDDIRWGWIDTNGKINFDVGNDIGGASGMTSINPINDNRWHHIAMTRNAATGELALYVDGILNDSGTSKTGTITTLDITKIGAIDGDFNPNADYIGLIDNIRIFNYPLSSSQIAWDFNRGAPLGYWQFDECSGATAYDKSGNSFNGTISSGISGNTTAGTCGSGTSTEMWYDGTDGKYNSSLGFDGIDDYVSIADNVYLRFDNAAQDFSLFAWIKRTTTGTEYILSKEDADDDGWRMLFNSSNQVVCSVDATDVTSTNTITDTNWHFIGCTIDRDGNGQIYIDGNANGSTMSMGSDAMATTSTIRIGTRSYTSTSYFNGLIDDVRIYNYALTASQVKIVMNQESAIRFGPATGSP